MRTTYLIIPPPNATSAQLPPPYAAFVVAAVHEIELQFATADLYQVLTGDYDGVKAEIRHSLQARLGTIITQTVGHRQKSLGDQ